MDPLGGSYLVESMTDAIDAAAEAILAQISEMGGGSMLEGVLQGIEDGWFQRELADSAFKEQRRFESGDLVRVGVNAFQDELEGDIDTLVIGPATESQQREALELTRSSRDAAVADAAIAALTVAAAGDVNLLPLLLDCARARCTEGEIVVALKSIFGDYREDPQL
jgi:methylmalonyl-CoA mutase N-terminal domain/subunit